MRRRSEPAGRKRKRFVCGLAGCRSVKSKQFRCVCQTRKIPYLAPKISFEPMTSEITIRPERQEEFSAVYDLVRVAFQTARMSDGDEQDYVERLRRGQNYIPELSLVACCGGELAGQVMLSKTFVRPDRVSVSRPEPFRVLLLAPLAVKLEYRRRGIGAMLVNEAFRRARELGWTAVVLVGDPAYYGRLGFSLASRYGIYAAEDRQMYEPYLQIYELTPGALDGVSGTLEF